jgi:hypothetical protein
MKMTNEQARPKISELFDEMESAVPESGTVRRRVFNSPSSSLILFVNADDGTRSLRFEFVDQLTLPGEIEQVKGLQVMLDSPSAAKLNLSLQHVRPSDGQLFAALAQNIFDATAEQPGLEAKTTADRLAHWRLFFSRNQEGLSAAQQLGLFAELQALGLLAAAHGADAAVQRWEGPHSEIHDFSTDSWALEVKATSGPTASATISNERQLDPSTVSPLYLLFFAFDVRPHGLGETLPSLVNSTRQLLVHIPVSAASFEDLLLDAGYSDAHARLYGAHYQLARQDAFKIGGDFPSLREASLPPAVSRTQYALNLDLCEPWRIEVAQALTGAKSGATHGD